VIDFKALSYLNRRGYSLDLVNREGVRAVPAGRHIQAGLAFGCIAPSLVFTCRTMSGALQGLVLASWGEQEKRYEWRPSPARWLPICYAQPDDWEIFYETGEVILVEGVFDRIALKRCAPKRAVIARLSKSVTAIQWILKRYAKRIWVAFDQDEEGEKGARRLGWRLDSEVRGERAVAIRRLTFFGKDPGEHFERYGEGNLRLCVVRQLEAAIV
jgi:hypothetical protein